MHLAHGSNVESHRKDFFFQVICSMLHGTISHCNGGMRTITLDKETGYLKRNRCSALTLKS